MTSDPRLREALIAYVIHRDAIYADEEAGMFISPDRWTVLGDEARAIVDALAGKLASP